MSPHPEASARRPVERDRADDLRGLTISALAFRLVVGGAHPLAVAEGVDHEGRQHFLAVRSAAWGAEVAYVDLVGDLVRRGLSVTRPLIVDIDGCLGLVPRLDRAFGPVALAGVANGVRGGGGLAW